MKRTIACFYMLFILLGLAACGNTAQVQQPEPSAAVHTSLELLSAAPGDGIQNVSQPEKQSRILVAYFSATGTTKQVAGMIAEQTGADLYEITPEIPYTPADLNYGDSSSRTTAEQNNSSSRPAISGSIERIDN